MLNGLKLISTNFGWVGIEPLTASVAGECFYRLGCCATIASDSLIIYPGLFTAPAPHHPQNILATKCLDLGNHRHKDLWFIPRDHIYKQSCASINDLHEQSVYDRGITANEIVFAFQFPTPRDSMDLKMSRWFQNIISILHIEVHYDSRLHFGGCYELWQL